jgi:hypothetical protein
MHVLPVGKVGFFFALYLFIFCEMQLSAPLSRMLVADLALHAMQVMHLKGEAFKEPPPSHTLGIYFDLWRGRACHVLHGVIVTTQSA